jgi:mannose-1-phosphate guanylyltransferase
MQALVLAGGSGTRFWPLSRKSNPKQLLALEGEQTLLQATVARLAPLIGPESVWVCTTRSISDQVRAQLPAVPEGQILLEPMGRDTSAAIGWSVSRIHAAVGDEVVVVLPADHRVGEPAPFLDTLERAQPVAAEGSVLALGVEPRWAETGYGYLELGETLDAETGLRRVRRFTEKPDAATAQAFLESGNYRWNGGIFVFLCSVLLRELERSVPELAAGLAEIARRPEAIDELYGGLPRVSIDYGVMEKLDDLVTLPLDCDWSDLGGWAALAEILPPDGSGNAVKGSVVTVEAADNLLYADRGTIAALGVRDLVVVRTGDTVLVVPIARAQEVKQLIAKLQEGGLEELL